MLKDNLDETGLVYHLPLLKLLVSCHKYFKLMKYPTAIMLLGSYVILTVAVTVARHITSGRMLITLSGWKTP